MSRPDLEIIHSPEAETFLRMVTKGFYSGSYIGLWIYEVIGREWDELRQWSDGMCTEIHPQTCTWSIAIWEWVYGFEPDETLTLEDRRRRIFSKVTGTRPINPEVLRRGIAAVAGADVEISDFTAPYRFSVTLNVTDNPIPMERVLQYINDVKPAHLSVSVEAVFQKMEGTLHMGGAFGTQTALPVPEAPDEMKWLNTLRLGGGMALQSVLPIP